MSTLLGLDELHRLSPYAVSTVREMAMPLKRQAWGPKPTGRGWDRIFPKADKIYCNAYKIDSL